MWHNLSCCRGICLKGLKEITKNISQYSWCSSQNWNWVPNEFNWEAVQPNQLIWSYLTDITE